jgi:hypothetical protein
VIAQSAGPGFDLRRFQTLTVAEQRDEGMIEGKRWIRMPELLGLSPTAASDVLTALDLTRIETRDQIADGDCRTGTICSSSPATGERAFIDSTQLLYVGVLPPPPSSPDQLDDVGGSDDTGSVRGGTYSDSLVGDSFSDEGSLSSDSAGVLTSDDADLNSDSPFDDELTDAEPPGYEPLFPVDN